MAPNTAKVLTCVVRLLFIQAVVGLGLHLDGVCELQIAANAHQEAPAEASEEDHSLGARFAELSVVVSEDERTATIRFVSRGEAHEYLLDRFNVFAPAARLVKHSETGDVPVSDLPLSFRSREKNKRATLTRRADNVSTAIFEFEGQLYQLDPHEVRNQRHARSGDAGNHYAYSGAHRLSMVKKPHFNGTAVQLSGTGEVPQKPTGYHHHEHAGGPARPADGPSLRADQTRKSRNSSSGPTTPERHRPEGHVLILDKDGPVAVDPSKNTRHSNTSGIERSDPSQDYEGTEWLGTEWYPDCFDGDENMHQFEVGLIGDFQAYNIYGDTLASMLVDYVSKASLIYEGQMHIELVIGYLEIFATAEDAPSWANPCASTGSFADNAHFQATFYELKDWYEDHLTPVTYFSDSEWFEGHLHGFTGCGPDLGLVGLAIIGTICNPWAAGMGMTQIQSSNPDNAWLIFAHELGHSMGAYHPFDRGEPPGGIMDYGDGTVDGVYQFNTPYRRDEVCTVLDKALRKCPQQFYDKVNGETPAPTPEFVCEDEPSGWTDSYGDSCVIYWWADYCTNSGGFGQGWGANWGTFAGSSNLGTSAEFACCECGGGKYVSRAPTPFPSSSPVVAPTQSPTLAPTTASPTESPTAAPTALPTKSPTESPTTAPTSLPTASPTESPSTAPTALPTMSPTESPTALPTASPTESPSTAPTPLPTASPSESPTVAPTALPTESPTENPTTAPTSLPTASPTESPSTAPTPLPTASPSESPTAAPTALPTESPTENPTAAPTSLPTASPTESPSTAPTLLPTASPSESPTTAPTPLPTSSPTESPTEIPTSAPTHLPTTSPTEFPAETPTSAPTWSWHHMPSKGGHNAEATPAEATTTSRPQVAPLVRGDITLAALNYTALAANATLQAEVVSLVKEKIAFKTNAALDDIVVTLKDGSTSRRSSTGTSVVAEYTVTLDTDIDVSSVTAELSDPAALADVATEVEQLPGIEAVATGEVQVLASSAEEVAQSPATAFGDPHLKNVRGEVFDVEREGDLTFLVVPENADQESAKFYAQAHVDRRRGASCGALYITGLVLTGEALGEFKRLEFRSLTEDFNTPGSRSLKIDDSTEMSVDEFIAKVEGSEVVTEVTLYDPEEPTKLNHHVTTLMLRVNFGIGKLKLRWEHQKEKDGYTNWLYLEFTGLGAAKNEIGGLLGTADHAWVSSIPEECVETHRKVTWGFMAGSASFD